MSRRIFVRRPHLMAWDAVEQTLAKLATSLQEGGTSMTFTLDTGRDGVWINSSTSIGSRPT
jgi:hypothetical protein